ncbi:hypothetical protein R50071_34130 [Halioxenophilus aromaticivorans]
MIIPKPDPAPHNPAANNTAGKELEKKHITALNKDSAIAINVGTW